MGRSDQREHSLRILRGNLAPEGAVGKITGKEGLYFKGTAKVYESEETALEGILKGDVVKGDVVVIRNEGPVGGPECVKCSHRPVWLPVVVSHSRSRPDY